MTSLSAEAQNSCNIEETIIVLLSRMLVLIQRKLKGEKWLCLGQRSHVMTWGVAVALACLSVQRYSLL